MPGKERRSAPKPSFQDSEPWILRFSGTQFNHKRSQKSTTPWQYKAIKLSQGHGVNKLPQRSGINKHEQSEKAWESFPKGGVAVSPRWKAYLKGQVWSSSLKQSETRRQLGNRDQRL